MKKKVGEEEVIQNVYETVCDACGKPVKEKSVTLSTQYDDGYELMSGRKYDFCSSICMFTHLFKMYEDIINDEWVPQNSLKIRLEGIYELKEFIGIVKTKCTSSWTGEI